MKFIASFLMLGFLTACGGSGGGGSEQGATSETITGNLALTSNGAEVTATYDADSAEFTTDGDNTTALYWAGNIENDSVTVNLGSIAEVTELSVYTNDLSFSTSNPSKYIEISRNGEDWNTTAQIANGDIACRSFSLGSGKIFCEFDEAQEIQYVRVIVMAGSTNIYEIEAIGSRTRAL